MASWGITPGNAGMEAQVRALADAIGVPVEIKKTQLHPLLAWLPNACFLPFRKYLMHFTVGEKLSAPWPDIVISCGRRGAAVAIGLKTKAPHTRFIHIQDPRVSSRYFDAVVAMEHDKISGPNVVKTRFALHSITPEKLAAAREEFAPRFAGYHPPYVAVLLGGSTNKYTLTGYGMDLILVALQRFQETSGASLFITPSRRTGTKNIQSLMDRFQKNDRVYVYNLSAENPYMGLLALADAIIVTDDSVNMMSEAQATGKPLYILPLPGHRNTKPSRFAEHLMRDGIARPLGDKLERWSYDGSDEMQRVAQEVRRLAAL